MPAEKTLLLTGFTPFGPFAVNPSERIVNALSGATIAGHRVEGLVLPVVFGEAGDRLIEAVSRENPRVVICLGLAGNRDDIGIERLAVNLDHADIPDNAGNQPVDRPIVPGGPPAYWSTLPVQAMAAALREAGIAASLSLSAGTFVCNHVFYRLMQALAERPHVRGGFIHLPAVADTPGTRDVPDALLTGTRTVIKTVVG